MVGSGHVGGNEVLGSSGAMVIDQQPAKEVFPSFAPPNLNNDLIASEKEFERIDHFV